MWIVYATPPKTGWPFKENYFPRTVKYKERAEQLVVQAKNHGATSVRMEKVKK